MNRNPVVFVSYSHDSVVHKERVERLVNELRAKGIDCRADCRVNGSPPEGWPRWMKNQISEAAFVLVVCTQVYLERFEGNEEPGRGLGANWEGAIITQELYESSGSNTKFIPVVCDSVDADCIPIVLRSQTKYNFVHPEEFKKLYSRLTETDEPASRLGEIIPLPKKTQARLFSEPSNPPDETSVRALHVLARFEFGLPASVLSTCLNIDETRIKEKLKTDKKFEFIEKSDVWKISKDCSVQGLECDDQELVEHAFRESLTFVSRNRRDPASVPVTWSLLSVASKLKDKNPELVVQLFKSVEKSLKRSGERNLLWECAKVTIEVARRPGRMDGDVHFETQALICGRSWVLQRTNQLEQALAEAQKSFSLGTKIGDQQNTAFCHKCLGRLYRMLSIAPDNTLEKSIEMFELSKQHLNGAIEHFSSHPDFGKNSTEVGDSYSLLGRTLLVFSDRRGAMKCAREAHKRLDGLDDKDSLDLELLFADISVDEKHYEDAISRAQGVLDRIDPLDCQQSEIAARAHVTLGNACAIAGKTKKAAAHFDAASTISNTLHEDHSAAIAEWRRLLVTKPEIAKIQGKLSRLDYRERVLAANSHLRRLSLNSRTAVGHRAEPGDQYFDVLVKDAKKESARLGVTRYEL